jgi:hypothetical protein
MYMRIDETHRKGGWKRRKYRERERQKNGRTGNAERLRYNEQMSVVHIILSFKPQI